MKKLSIILWTSLVTLGLLCTSNANALSYTVEWNTQVTIPKTQSAWITIDRWDWETITVSTSTWCSDYDIQDKTYLRCTKTYLSWSSHQVSVNNANDVDTIYLNSANIRTITNLNWLGRLINLYLDNNNLQTLSNTFTSSQLPSLRLLSLSNNNLTSFSETSIISNLTKLDLSNNSLPIIPVSVWNVRSSSEILLPNNITLGNSTRLVDLRNNPINFIEIMSSSNSTTNYSTQVFGYTYSGSILDDWDIKYNYKIYPKNYEENIILSGTFNGDNWANTNANIQFTSSLEPGTYTFKVCIDGTTDVCKEKDFNISYIGGVEIDPISAPNTIEDINVSRKKTWNYPDEFISGYIYEFDGEQLNTTPDNRTSYTITTAMLQDNPAWPHTFKVYLKGLNWTPLDDDERTFSIDINNEITIINPSPRISWEWISQTWVTLEWDNESTIFDHYIYSLSTADTCSAVNESNSIKYNTTIPSTSTINWKYTYDVNLGRWTYILCIDMYSNNKKLTDEPVYRKFAIEFLPTLAITQPSDSVSTQPIEFKRTSSIPDWYGFKSYEYSITAWSETIYSGKSNNVDDKSFTYTEKNLSDDTYTFNVTLKYIDTSAPETLKTLPIRTRTFEVNSNTGASLTVTPANWSIFTWKYTTQVPVTLSWNWWGSLLIKNYFYRLTNTNTSQVIYSWYVEKNESWTYSIGEKSLWDGTYKFDVYMLDSYGDTIRGKSNTFTVSLPPSIKITSPTSGATVTSSSTTFSWIWYSDNIGKYEYQISGDPTIYSTRASTVTSSLKNWTYTLTVWLYKSDDLSRPAAEDSINFTVNIPVKTSWGWGSSWKTHYTNNLKLSLWNDSPATNEWIKLIVKIDDKYVWKVTFPKLQHYSADTEKREDIPVTSKNYVSDYSDDAKLWYIKFASDEDWRKDLEQFIKFSKNWYYRIFAEDKDWYDTYIEFKVSGKTTQAQSTTTQNNNTVTNNTVNNSNTIDSIIQRYIPEVYAPQDTSEEVYIARSCKKYTIQYSESLNVYTSPNLNMNEYFVSKEYFKRYVDSKNKYQSWCPTNIWWISTNYADRTNDNTRYTAPNGKVYFITWRDWNYYSNELNKELKTPTSFRTIQELKYYIRDRNPLISMAALWPTN